MVWGVGPWAGAAMRGLRARHGQGARHGMVGLVPSWVVAGWSWRRSYGSRSGTGTLTWDAHAAYPIHDMPAVMYGVRLGSQHALPNPAAPRVTVRRTPRGDTAACVHGNCKPTCALAE